MIVKPILPLKFNQHYLKIQFSAKNLIEPYLKDKSLYPHECEICHKKYKYLSGFYSHRNKFASENIIEDIKDLKTVILFYIQTYDLPLKITSNII